VPPDAFGRFRVLHQIGAGTLGPVFRAHDPASDRPVAVKLFTLDLSAERVQQFVVELQNLVGKDLSHPGIAAPLAAGMHGASAYLVQEFVTADSLDLVIREYGAAPPNDALRVAAQLAGALDFANAVQVRHGALHPRDVLLSSDETRVTGLGVAHALERIGIGAPVRRPYTPPERIAAGEWDRRSDVFSLAALAHELLWARRIAGSGSRAAEGLTPIPGADLDVLKAVFTRALAEDASERFETSLEFADALRAAFPEAAASLPVSISEFTEDDDPAAAHIFPQATPAAPAPEKRAPAGDTRAKPEERRPATEPALPLVDRHAEVDLPLAEVARAERERYRDVEVAPAIVPPVKDRASGGAAAAASSRYLDYVREDQPVPAATQPAGAAAPVVVRPGLQPTLTHEPPRSTKVPILLALAVGLMLGFGAGYGFGLRQRVAPPPPAVADALPPPGREFTESAVPDAAKPAPAPIEPTPPASSAERQTPPPVTPPAAAPSAVSPSAATPPPAASSPVFTTPATPPSGAPRTAPPRAATGPPTDGRLLVRTTPAGARLFIDEREYGVTPFAARNLARGSHRVRVTRDGYNTEDRRVVITAAQPSQSLTIPLERQGAAASRGSQPARTGETGSTGRFAGDLLVDSRPPGATVFLDGKAVGTTPLSLRAVAAGSHVVRLEHEGYRRWSSAVRVVASQANRITASLER
jgi:serine/threonine protein kinase